MHPSHAFQGEATDALAIAGAHPFAAISAWDGEALTCIQAPLIPVRDPEGRVTAFEGHVARANVFVSRLIDGRTVPAVAVFAGPDAYVSPSSYASKAEHGRVVPTWNYLTAEAHGHLQLIDDAQETLAILDRQSAAFEADFDQPWSLDDAPADYVSKLARAIIGVRLELTCFNATIKLSQNKTGADFSGVVNGLMNRNDDKAHAVAALMNELQQS